MRTMRITMKTIYSCPAFTAQAGDTLDVDAKLGKQLIERRYAVAAGTDPAKRRKPAAATEPVEDDGQGDQDPDDIDTGTGDPDGQEPDDEPPADPEPADSKPAKRSRKGGKLWRI